MAEPTRVAFVSLGCAKNLVDSEMMLGRLAEAGCVITNDEDDADAVVINTCGFLEASRTEADQIIQELVAKKGKGRLKRVVVAGCLVQRDGVSIAERIPGIDALVGVHLRDDVVRAVTTSLVSCGTGAPSSEAPASTSAIAPKSKRESTRRKRRDRVAPDLYLSDYHQYQQLDTGRMRLTPRHYAYLRISEGCDQKCTFCTIPAIRGPMRCKPPKVILAEARELVADGAVELHLIGQDTTSYGLGADPFDGGLAALLRALDGVDGLEWIRLMYVYPSVMTDAIIDAVAECEKVCNYIDIPLQHINDRVLKSMHRRIDRATTEGLLAKLRDRIPGVCIRTTMIAGFPGETEAEFDELVAFVKDFRFAALGVFPYSLEPDTPAGRMKGQLPKSVLTDRVETLMLAQQDVAFALADERAGTVCSVLIDGTDDAGLTVGRYYGQAPSVDSVTYVEGPSAPAGSFAEVRFTGRRDYDLLARPTKTALPVLGA